MPFNLSFKSFEKPSFPDSLISKSAFKPLSSAGVVLLVSLVITLLATLYMKSSVERIANHGFVDQCDKLQREISDRLDDHERILLSGVALFKASDGGVTREEWHTFTQTQDVDKQLPGIQGIGYAVLISPESLHQHIETLRLEGFPEYTLSPEGNRKTYSAIIYLEPFTVQNQRAFGYDMFSEPVRRDAMERARDTGEPSLSGKVLLVQEAETDVQAGNLMYIALYQKGMPIETVEQRRAALIGWVYSPYRMTDLMQGILASNADEHIRTTIEVFDGERPSSQSLLYSGTPEGLLETPPRVGLTRQLPVEFYGHSWTLRFTQPASNYSSVEYLRVWLTLLGGLFITILLFKLAYTSHRAKIKALKRFEIRTLELRESERNFSSIVETLPVAIYASTGVEQICTYLNPMFIELFGYTIEDVPTVDHWWPLAFPEKEYREKLKGEWTAKVGEAIETQSKIEPMEAEVTCKDGSKKYVSWGYVSVGENNYAFGIDLTERVQAEEALHVSKRKYKGLTEVSPSGIWQTNAIGNCIYVSPRWSEITGISAEGARGSGWSEDIHPEDKEEIFRGWMQATKDRSDYRSEFRFVRPDGSVVWVLCIASAEVDEHGNVTGWIGTITDITRLKQIEEQLHESKFAAESANTAKSQFLANMSHEIRTPMNGILGMTQLLEMTTLSVEQREFVEALEASGKNLLSLIDDILDLSKIEAGETTFELNEFSLRDCINGIVKMHKTLLSYKSLSLKVDMADEIPSTLIGDQLRIKQILHNLLSNAVKFTEQGTVTLSAQVLKNQGSTLLVQIEVSDTGIGISSDALEKVFLPFSQEDATTTRKYGGTGLGLTISRNLAELMGGHLRVESTKGIGSRFILTVPLAMPTDKQDLQRKLFIDKVHIPGQPLRILYAEDDPLNSEVGSQLLGKFGHEITVVENGKDCLVALDKSHFDVVLMDIQMPVMDGRKALLEIRKKEAETSNHQPVIALTANAMRGEKERLLAEGFDGYVSKPMELNGLLHEIRLALGVGVTTQEKTDE